MAEILILQEIPPQFPDHTQLPESDGMFIVMEVETQNGRYYKFVRLE